MAKTVQKAIIKIQGLSGEVAFEGVWTKRLVDIAHNMMLKELPKHLLSIRSTTTEESDIEENAK